MVIRRRKMTKKVFRAVIDKLTKSGVDYYIDLHKIGDNWLSPFSLRLAIYSSSDLPDVLGDIAKNHKLRFTVNNRGLIIKDFGNKYLNRSEEYEILKNRAKEELDKYVRWSKEFNQHTRWRRSYCPTP
jgi:hypothetical protein